MTKRRDVYSLQKQRFEQELERASTLKQKYPFLDSLEITIIYEDWDDGKLSEPQKKIYGPNTKAFFKFKCPHIECISGGFDISESISAMLNSSEIETSGESLCQGWQDEERINKHRCF